MDIEGALQLVDEFEEPFFAVIKHTNPCGCAIGKDLLEAWQKALASDPVSAFGGILACNRKVDLAVAEAMNDLFFEVLLAPDFSEEALELLSKKKNRILLKRKQTDSSPVMIRHILGGYLVQDRDLKNLTPEDLAVKTSRKPSESDLADVYFGDKVVKHLKSNAIALVKNQQLIGSGVGQTSRIDALNQALAKAEEKGFTLQGAVLASDAFFPFSDAVEMAFEKGIRIVTEPGGSIRDEDTVNFCENHDMCLIFTGLRHFKH